MSVCKFCHSGFGQYERMLMFAANSRRWQDAKFAHDYDCLFQFVRQDMDGAVIVYRLRNPDRLTALKQNLTK